MLTMGNTNQPVALHNGPKSTITLQDENHPPLEITNGYCILHSDDENSGEAISQPKLVSVLPTTDTRRIHQEGSKHALSEDPKVDGPTLGRLQERPVEEGENTEMKLRSRPELRVEALKSQAESSSILQVEPESLLQGAVDHDNPPLHATESSDLENAKVYGAGNIPVNRDHSYSRKLKQGVLDKLEVVEVSEVRGEDSGQHAALHKKQRLTSDPAESVVVVQSLCDVEKPGEEINVTDCEPLETVVIAYEVSDRTLVANCETGETNGSCETIAVVTKSEPEEPAMDDSLTKQDEDGSATSSSSPRESKDQKKKARRSTNGKVSDQSSSSSTDDVPRRRSNRIRSLEEKKEKTQETKPKKERTPKGTKQDLKKKNDAKGESKLESLASHEQPAEARVIEPVLLEDHKGTPVSVKIEIRDDSSNGDTNSVASTDSFAAVPVVPIEPKVFASPMLDMKREEESSMRHHEKVKSRWRRNSEREQVCVTSLPVPVPVLPPVLEEEPPPPPPLPVAIANPVEKDLAPTPAVPEPQVAVTPPLAVLVPESPAVESTVHHVPSSEVPMEVDIIPEPTVLPLRTVPALSVPISDVPAPVPVVPSPISEAPLAVPVVVSVVQAPVSAIPAPLSVVPDVVPAMHAPVPALPTQIAVVPPVVPVLSAPGPAPVKQESAPAVSKPGAQDPEVKSPTFESIDENIYLFDRRRSKSKKEVRRMLCDCTLLKEDKERGIMGCTQDCLNRLLMIECGPRCLLGEACSNKKFQKKAHANVEHFKTDKKGWGLRAREDLSSGCFVMEYVGEVLSPVDFKQRVKHYAKGKNDHYYFMALKGDEIIDATVKGNLSRFINHSCSPNCETQKWTVNGELRIGFFTTRDVKAYEELTFDYQFQRYGREAQRCYCESSNCRGFIGGDTQVPIKSNKTYVQKKQRSRKREVLEDLALEEEIEKLSGNGGLKNQQQTLLLARLMVRAEDHDTRQQLLDIIQHTTEQACLRLFLDYHGLSLLWSWMVDLSDDSSQLKSQILQILSLLPVPNKTMLLDSKVFNVVQRWAAQPVSSPAKAEPADPTVLEGAPPVALDKIPPPELEKGPSPVLEKGPPPDAEVPLPTQSAECLNSENFIIDDLDSIPLPPMPPPPPVKKTLATEAEPESLDPKILKLPGCIVFDPLEGSTSTEDSKDSAADQSREMSPPEGQSRETSPPEGQSRETSPPEGVKIAPCKSSDSDESHDTAEEDETGQKTDVAALAAKILDAWGGLKEVFRIPRVEQEKRKEDERAAALQPGGESPRHKLESSPSSRSRKRHKDDAQDRKFNMRGPLLPTPPKMSKEERRQLFAMEVQQRDQEEAIRRQQMTSTPMPFMYDMPGFPPMAFDPNTGFAVDPNTGFPIHPPNPGYPGYPIPPNPVAPNTGYPIDPNTGYPIQTNPGYPLPPNPIDPNTGYPIPPNTSYQLPPPDQYQIAPGAIDPNTGYPVPPMDPGYQLQATSIDPNTGYPLQTHMDPNASYPTVGVDPNTGYPIQATPVEAGYPIQSAAGETGYSVQQCVVESNPAFAVQIPTSSVPAEESVTSSVVTSSSLPVYSGGQIFQQTTTTYPPPTTQVSYLPTTVTSSQVTTTTSAPLLPVVTVAPPAFQVASPATNSPQVASSPSVVIPASPVIPAVTSFVAPSTPQPFLASTAQGTTQLYYVQSTGAVVSIPPEQTLSSTLGPLVHVAVCEELPTPPPKATKTPTKLPPNWKTAKDEEGNVYYYHSITRETQWDPPTMDDDEDEEEGESMDLGTPTFDEPKVGIRIKHHASSSSSSSSKKKTTTAAADTSSEVAKKIKELFRSKMSGYIVQCLNPYRKPDCKLGHISNTEDFKHLARKLTHFVMSKELKYCKNVEDLECNENVKHKAKDFVYKYMSKYGAEYRKDKHGSPGGNF